MQTMEPSDVAAVRLTNQRIVGKKHKTPVDVVRWMGAMQAQDYGQAVWAIGQRLQKPSLAAVEEALADGSILRTWPMRGTIHFVPSEDAKWMVNLMSARPLATDKRRADMLGLTHQTYDVCRKLLQEALAGRKLLSRPAIMQLFEDNGISTAGQRGYHILWYLAQTCVICIGPMDGKQQTFALLDEWAANTRELSHEEALYELAVRYVQSHGPVTTQDFATWTHMKLSDIKQALQLASDKLKPVQIEGTEYWIARDSSTTGVPPTGIQLLPGFDEYLLGYKGRSAMLDLEHATKVVPGGNGVFFPMLVVDGKICGTWKRTVKAKTVGITVTPFVDTPLNKADLAVEAARYGEFLGLEANLSINKL